MRFRLGRQAKAVEQAIDELRAAGAVRRIAERDATLWGGGSQRQASVGQRLGWLDVASSMQQHAADLRAFGKEIADDGIESVVLLGMGGSSLAPEVLRRSIVARRGAPRLFVLDSTDPETIRNVARRIRLDRTLIVVSSKSGGTIEVATLSAYFHDLVSSRVGGGAGRHFVAITDSGTSLEALAHEKGFRRTFLNRPNIGGRYSALSYFGMVPAAAAGVDVERLLGGAEAYERSLDAEDHDALRLGATIGALARSGCDKLTFMIAPEIGALGLWLEQLIAESTGKEGTGVLPVADEPLGSPRRYGQDRLFVQMRLEGGYNGEQDSVAGGLEAEGHPVVVISLDSPYELGREFLRWEYATAVAGIVLGINPFDEPNVQESKDNTARVLRQFEATGTLDAAVVDGEPAVIGADGVAGGRLDVAIAETLGGLDRAGYLAIVAYLTETDETNAAFADIRSRVRDALGVATTLGYGPRYLHSTGQFHKGGRTGGVFLLVTAQTAADLAIPGRPYTFGQLKRAQAIGDFESLVAHGRPVLRVHLGGDVSGSLGQLTGAVRQALTRAGA